MDWFALTVRDGAEIETAGRLGRWGVVGEVPTVLHTVRGRWTRKAHVRAWPALPGYLFALLAPGQWPLLRRARAVMGVVSIDGAPRPLSEREMGHIRGLAERMQDEITRTAQASAPCRTVLHMGDMVHVVGTAFDGSYGRVTSDRPRSGDRWLVDLGLAHGAVAIPLDALQCAA